MPRYTITGTGRTATARGKAVRYWADFDTGSATATVRFEMKTEEGNWIPADAAITATMDAAKTSDLEDARREFSWNCSAYTTGTVYVELD